MSTGKILKGYFKDQSLQGDMVIQMAELGHCAHHKTKYDDFLIIFDVYAMKTIQRQYI